MIRTLRARGMRAKCQRTLTFAVSTELTVRMPWVVVFSPSARMTAGAFIVEDRHSCSLTTARRAAKAAT